MSAFWILFISVLFFGMFHASVIESPDKTELKRSKRLTTFGGGSTVQNSNQQQQNNQNKKPLHQPCRTDYDCGASNSECRTNASSYNPNTMMCYCKENYEEIDNECSGVARTVLTVFPISLAILFFKFHIFFYF